MDIRDLKVVFILYFAIQIYHMYIRYIMIYIVHWTRSEQGFNVSIVELPARREKYPLLTSWRDVSAFKRNTSTMSGNSRSREFPGIPASNSRPESREWNLPLAFPFPKMGMEFSICIPVPENGNGIYHSHSRSRKSGMEFSTRIPVPEIGNGIFHSHSRSRNLGMEFGIPVPLPEVQKSFPLTPDRLLFQRLVRWQFANVSFLSIFTVSQLEIAQTLNLTISPTFLLHQIALVFEGGVAQNSFMTWNGKVFLGLNKSFYQNSHHIFCPQVPVPGWGNHLLNGRYSMQRSWSRSL